MQLMIGSLDIQLQRKTIKHLHISVMPPNGEIRVAAPEAMTETAIRMAVIHRIPWIRKQQASFIKQARQSTREMINGETHYLWGRRYRLEVLELDTAQNLAPNVKLKGGKLILSVHTKTSTTDRLKLLNEYYRTRLKARIPTLVTQWSKQLKVNVCLGFQSGQGDRFKKAKAFFQPDGVVKVIYSGFDTVVANLKSAGAGI